MRGNLIYWLVLAVAAAGAGYAVVKYPGDWWLALIALAAVTWLLRRDPMKKGVSAPVLAEREEAQRVQIRVRDLAAAQALYLDGLELDVDLVPGDGAGKYQFVVTDIGRRYQWAVLNANVVEQLAKDADGRLRFALKDADGNVSVVLAS